MTRTPARAWFPALAVLLVVSLGACSSSPDAGPSGSSPGSSGDGPGDGRAGASEPSGPENLNTGEARARERRLFEIERRILDWHELQAEGKTGARINLEEVISRLVEESFEMLHRATGSSDPKDRRARLIAAQSLGFAETSSVPPLLQEAWRKVVREDIASRTRLDTFGRGVLAIVVEEEPLREELESTRRMDLLRRLREVEPRLRIADLEFRARGDHHRRAGAALADLLASGDDKLIEYALWSFYIRREKDDPIDLVARHLGAESAAIRRNAALAIYQMVREGAQLSERAAPVARSRLLAQCHDRDPYVRAAAAAALGRVGTQEDPAYEDTLINLLDDDDLRVRLRAVIALARIGGPTSLDPLCDVLESEIPNLRHHAKLVLAVITNRLGYRLDETMLEDDAQAWRKAIRARRAE